MPCVYETDAEEAHRLRSELSEATKVACEATNLVRNLGKEGELTPKARNWLKVHDELDAERRAARFERLEADKKHAAEEAAREAALAKLTPAERVLVEKRFQ